jgi:hypothetical protein
MLPTLEGEAQALAVGIEHVSDPGIGDRLGEAVTEERGRGLKARDVPRLQGRGEPPRLPQSS